MEEKNKNIQETNTSQKEASSIEDSIKKDLAEKPDIAEVKKKDNSVGREYIIPLREKCRVVPRYKKTNKAIKTIKEFLVRHMKIRDRDLNKIKIDKYLNEFIWARGIKNPPSKIKVNVIKDGDIIRVELSDIPKKLKFKKERLEKRERNAQEGLEKKKPVKETAPLGVPQSTELKGKEKKEEKTSDTLKDTSEKKEEREKTKAGEEATKQMEKTAAKQTKHSAGGKTKQPKHPVRKALAK